MKIVHVVNHRSRALEQGGGWREMTLEKKQLARSGRAF